MLQKSTLFLVAALLAGCAAPSLSSSMFEDKAVYNRELSPVDAAATQTTRRVHAYLLELEQGESPRILTGQFLGFGSLLGRELPAKIHAATGKWPALIGVDYADFKHGALSYKEQNAVALEYWRSGGLISVSVHLYNPANPNRGGLRDKGVNLDSLLEEGSETHRRWMEQVDFMADGLAELQQAGAVVLFRPFHEMNGGWFWWGAKEPAAFKRVWQHLFNHLTHKRGLHNLLWVFGPNHGPTAADYYPGDAWVDLVGLDAYTDHVDPEHIRGYEAMARINKPFGFTEYGPHGSQNPPGDFDYLRFLQGVRTHFPRTTHFLSWDEKWSPVNNIHCKELYHSPGVLGRDELPAFTAPASH